MGRNLDFDNCTTEAVLAAYEQELNENERRICDEGAWAISLDMSRITYWYPILMRYCPNHPLTQDLRFQRELYKTRKDLADFFFFDWGFAFRSPIYGARTASDSQKWHGINREKGEQQKGNNHAKDPEHQHIIPSDGRPEAEVNEFLP